MNNNRQSPAAQFLPRRATTIDSKPGDGDKQAGRIRFICKNLEFGKPNFSFREIELLGFRLGGALAISGFSVSRPIFPLFNTFYRVLSRFNRIFSHFESRLHVTKGRR